VRSNRPPWDRPSRKGLVFIGPRIWVAWRPLPIKSSLFRKAAQRPSTSRIMSVGAVRQGASTIVRVTGSTSHTPGRSATRATAFSSSTQANEGRASDGNFQSSLGWNARSRARSACDGASAPPHLPAARGYASVFMKHSTEEDARTEPDGLVGTNTRMGLARNGLFATSL
jgi:hypothetical protein